MRDALLVLHILAAASWIGTNGAQVARSPTIASRGPVIAADWHRHLVTASRITYVPGAIVSTITGVWLVIDSDVYDFSHAFVSVGFLAIGVGAGLGMVFFAPQGRKAAEAYEAGDLDAAKAIEARISAAGVLDTAVVVVTVVAMVAKWGVS